MVKVKLDKERHLRLTLRGMLKFEEATGIHLFKDFKKTMTELTLEQTTVLGWACLIHEDKDLTFDEFQDFVDLSNINKLSDAVQQCIIESLAEKKSKDSAIPLAGKSH